jgi:hypothetical protein
MYRSGISTAWIWGVGLLGTKTILKFVRKIVPEKLPLQKRNKRNIQGVREE